MLEIRVLGGLEVIRDGSPAAFPPSRKTRALLAYLALTRGPHRREQLCEMFWNVPDDPRGALRWSLSKIRPLVPTPADSSLVAVRAIRASPFAQQPGWVYFAGYDANKSTAHNTAWMSADRRRVPSADHDQRALSI